MEPVTGVTPTTETTNNTNPLPTTQEGQGTAATGEFDKFVKALLSPNKENKVSEEALFAGLIGERLQKLKGDEASKKYSDELAKQKDAMKNGNGVIPVEKAAKAALKKLVDDKVLTVEEADKIYSQSFAAAQLDKNTEFLFDDMGGNGDTTIAVDTLEAALLSARVLIEKIDDGSETVKERKLSEATPGKAAIMGGGAVGGGATIVGGPVVLGAAEESPNGTAFDGQGGFLFKPVANSDGRLAVILPPSFTGNIEEVFLQDAAGAILDTGHFTSNGDEGLQSKFSFSKPGGSYPHDIKVVVKLSDGSTKTYNIPDPSKRYD